MSNSKTEVIRALAAYDRSSKNHQKIYQDLAEE
jgi:hypothetical protein